MRGVLVVLALCLAAVVSQSPANLYPLTADGFDTIWLDDQSFSTELSFQTGGNGEVMSYYVYGKGTLRTVYPGEDTFYVGSTPNEVWHVPFIDFHTFENGSDIWGFGPVNSVNFPLTPNPVQGGGVARNYTFPPGFEYQIVVVTTKQFPNNPYGIFWLEQPLGFEGTFSAVRVVPYSPTNIVGYFAGFFPSAQDSNVIQFGLVRGHFDVNIFASGDDNAGPGWTFNQTTDVAVIYNQTSLVAYNNEFKPILIHLWNVTSDPTQSYMAVVDPYWSLVTLVHYNWQDQTQPLIVNPSFNYRYNQSSHLMIEGAYIVSATSFGNLLLIGFAVDGQGTGWIDVVNTPSLTLNRTIWLPTNYSNPKALVVDYPPWSAGPTLYVGMNGGAAVLRINLTGDFNITGYQMLPHYLHRAWVGQPAPDHIYFATNEQHAKVFRVSKADFCSIGCMMNGYCKEGKCVCSEGYDMTNGQCQLHQITVEKRIVKRDHGGEVALGLLFMFTFLAAAGGWFMVWKQRRNGHHYEAM